MDQRKKLGAVGEELAVLHLKSLGWRILARNWRFSRVGELDIVAVDPGGASGSASLPGHSSSHGGSAGEALVFCEVKTRSGDRYGQPLEAVTAAKLKTLRRLAGAWMAGHDGGYPQVRIDVIGVLMRPGEKPQIVHLRGVGA